jgi:hypothetical protein
MPAAIHLKRKNPTLTEEERAWPQTADERVPTDWVMVELPGQPPGRRFFVRIGYGPRRSMNRYFETHAEARAFLEDRVEQERG